MRLRTLRAWVLVSSVAAAPGCAADAPALSASSQPLSTEAALVAHVACSDILLAVDPVKPVRPLDYIGVYRTNRMWGNELTLLGDHGVACRSAKDREACLASAAELLGNSEGCPEGSAVCPQLILTTQGDEVLRHDRPETLAHVLGEIDTASEAVLLAQLHGLYTACTQPGEPQFGTLVQQTSAGWRVQSRGDRCGGYDVDQSIELRNDGSSSGFDYNQTFATSGCTSTGG